LQKHPQVNGLSWWYAEANAKGCTGSLAEGWYNASLFDNETGRALPALYELKAFDDGSTGISSISTDSAQPNDAWYSLSGRKLESKPQQKGIYINKGEKLIIK
jgi:arabinogalactan endo-1,4-beta-galactosidase